MANVRPGKQPDHDTYPRLLLLAVALLPFSTSLFAAAPPRPNIVVILVDDMGFSDIGCYGSEIPTPNLDKLAADGLRFTQFYNTPRCSPTRAALLTGLYSHQAGMGWLDNKVEPKSQGFHGRLLPRCVTIAEVLRGAGYFTAMTGKWHLGQQNGTPPWKRGFINPTLSERLRILSSSLSNVGGVIKALAFSVRQPLLLANTVCAVR
ncbi:MAG: sulfatase-like hydrolase/transferase [Thermoguttaceae bacterium]